MAAAALKQCLDRRAEIERRYAGWHAWCSDIGTKYATHAWRNGGTTLAAGSWDDLEDQLDAETTPEGPSWAI